MLQYSYRPGAPPLRRTRTGADQAWSPYAAIVDRPKLRWPGGARVALWLCPCVLYYEWTPPADAWVDSWTRTVPPDVLGYGRQEYGNRVGFWRILEVMDAHKARCTAVVNSWALERWLDITKAIVDRNWGLLGHGMVNTRFVYGLSEAEERAYYVEMREHVERLTGIRLKGMGGPGPQAATESTPDLLAEAGYLYHADWFHDEQPFPLRTRAGRMISMPYSTEINDAPFLGVGFEADDFLEAIKRQFDRLYADGADNGRVMCVSLHSHLMGQPQRIRYLDEALRYILSHEGVWQATGDEIAEHYVRHHYDATMQWLERSR